MTNSHAPGRLSWILVFSIASLSGPACSAEHSTASQSVEDRTLIAVSKAIRQAHLVSRPEECFAYRFDANASGDVYLVEVRENHRHAVCGGDPQTQPRLFTVSVNKKTQAMATDRGSPGQFHPMPQAKP